MMKIKLISCVSHNSRAIAAYLLAAGAIIILSSYPLWPQAMSAPINLTYLVKRADIIVQGQVSDVQYESLPGYPNIQTIKVTIQVEGMTRGPQGDTYSFREILLGVRPKEGKGNYRVGQRLLLFLPTPSQRGLSQPIGLEQGRFHIDRDGKGNETISNEIRNAGLFKNVDEDVRQEGKALTANQRKLASTGNGPVALKDFSSLVQTMTALKRINEQSK
jgi:hypothetical protein